MHFTGSIIALVSVLPFLVSAEPNVGLHIKKSHSVGRKRQAPGEGGSGQYVSSYNQCMDVCKGYFPTIQAPIPIISPDVTDTPNVTTVIGDVDAAVQNTTWPTWGSNDTDTVTWGSNDTDTVNWGSNDTTTGDWGSNDTDTDNWDSSDTEPTPTASSVTPEESSATTLNSTDSAGGVTAAQQEEILQLHNAERAKYGASPLTWSTDLESYAFAHAQQCKWLRSMGPNGENIAASFGWADAAIAQGVNGWTDERSGYTPANPKHSHWTQIVWRGTTEIGCAMVKCPADSIKPDWLETDFLVCEYQAPGNIEGQFQANVGTKVA